MRGRIGYAEALKILGENESRTLKLIDRLLGGAILISAAVAGLGPLALLSVRDELIKQSEKLLASYGQRVRGAIGKGRTDLLVAAHAMVAVNAYFEALRDVQLPVDLGAPGVDARRAARASWCSDPTVSRSGEHVDLYAAAAANIVSAVRANGA
jgi:hypothetical protein